MILHRSRPAASLGVGDMRRACVTGALMLQLLSVHIVDAAITLQIEGLDDSLRKAAIANLELEQYREREISVTQVRRLFDRADEQIQEALEPYGYYNARVVGDLQRGEKEGDYKAVFKVERGEPVIVRDLKVQVNGGAQELPEVQRALKAFKPERGERLEHGAYEGSKANISAVMQSSGYFDSKLTQHRVEVTRSADTAAVDLAWNSGERYRFGATNFSNTQFPETFLKRYVPWKDGDFYSTEQLLLLQQRLVDADYFATVSVQPNLDQAKDGVVPIDALLIPARRTVYSAGAYMSTDSGLGGRLGMDRRWLNQRGHKMGGELEYSQRLESYSTYYRIPRPGPNNRNYNFAAGYRDEETDSSRSRAARLGAFEVLENWHGYTRSLGLQYLNGDFEIADEWQASSLLYAEATLNRKRANDAMFPSRGQSLTYTARLAAEGLLSDTSLVQLRADAKWVRPASSKSRLIMRASLGALAAGDFDALPPELRFFAGGDHSVRGFDYQSIGETNETGGVIGGKYLTVASVEYEYYFLPNWGIATFVDTGDAYSSSFHENVGTGIGLRWKSPVGIVRIDVAVPVVSHLDEHGVRLHVMLGPDL